MHIDNASPLRVADWWQDRTTLAGIRRQVFVEEQHVPEALEWDEFDAVSTHFLYTENGEAIATARLKPDGQIGRMAVLKACRRRGIGSALLRFVLATAAHQSMTQVYLHAQVTAIGFYTRHGFVPKGDRFLDADIPHQAMIRTLKPGFF